MKTLIRSLRSDFASNRINFDTFLAIRQSSFYKDTADEVRGKLDFSSYLGASSKKSVHGRTVRENPDVHVITLRDRSRSKFIQFDLDGRWSHLGSIDNILENCNNSMFQLERGSF